MYNNRYLTFHCKRKFHYYYLIFLWFHILQFQHLIIPNNLRDFFLLTVVLLCFAYIGEYT